MGEVELNIEQQALLVRSHIITYGNAATQEITEQIREEIECLWNEPKAHIALNGHYYLVIFQITAEFRKDLSKWEVSQNKIPRNNYFRIEEFAAGNISFVDDIGCNSGYFKLDDLYKGSTTAAHEYGHTLGLKHPEIIDIRGKGVPGIMYPRGTLVDSEFQYDPSKRPGPNGGTMRPVYRKVFPEDILDLKLHKLRFNNYMSVIGDFSNVYHWPHDENRQKSVLS